MQILLDDRDDPQTRYCSRFWSIFGCRDGVFSPLERARLQTPDAVLTYAHPDPVYERLMAAHLGVQPLCERSREKFDAVVDSNAFRPGPVLARLGDQIEADIALLKTARGDVFASLSGDAPGVHIVGDRANLFIHARAKIMPGTILDCSDGPIVIDDGARVGQFSYVAGPSYIGPGAQIDNCRVLGSVIGRQNRVGGEIESSIFGDFSNKHHEGFVGHSFVGRWVNLGALTTTSDLKNNYGEVRLEVPAPFAARRDAPLAATPTDCIKFGAILSDCVKTAIGTRINTGSVIDAGCNVFDMSPQKYTAPFVWGGGGAVYDFERFAADCRTIFARRQQPVSDGFVALARHLWTSVHE